ncbi:SPRY domain-containing protein 3 isoform X3 [Phyllostomus discolor]|uniref:SPRY domain-containing protein 3 isoform X3 n=1 Tax=Phyllostomus discolor TaxID=89673 RepID=A0A7E6D6I4_9CHIR|nr:SPRY domain-containing protein 3 isoform X3 [Phyllostomus discolor]
MCVVAAAEELECELRGLWMRRTRRPRPFLPTCRFVLMNKMDDLNLHYRFLNWRRRIREIREVRAFRYQERFKHILVDGDTLSYHGNSGEVGCYVASRPLTKDSNYFEVSIVDSGVRGTIAVGLVPQYYSLDHQPGWLPDSVAYHADDGKLYNGRAKGRQFGSKCNSGDRIGCGIEPVSFDVQTAQIFFTKNGKRVGSTIMPMSPDGLFPAVGMHSLGEEVRLHLNAELGREDDSVMMVDSYEDEWGRLHDVRVCGTDYPKNRHPGWSRGSVAYHADDGKIFHGSGVGDPFGPRCYKGDIMGCGIMFPRDYILDSEGDSDDSCDTVILSPTARAVRNVRNVMYLHQEGEEEEEEEEEEEDGEEIEQEHEGKKVVVFFTRNGKIIGKKDAVVPSGGFFPTIGMLSCGEKVKVDLHPLSG